MYDEGQIGGEIDAMTPLDLTDSMTATTDTAPAPVPPPRLGRRRDLSRDPEILEATLDVLAETGYDGMTIDMVAARAKAGKATVYRRWASKSELVFDAVACMKNADIDFDNLPDTGSLRGDLIAIHAPDGRPIARGLAEYDATDAARIAGRRSEEHAAILGYAPRATLVHRSHMAML